MSKKKKAAIVLFILQGVALLSSIFTGGIAMLLSVPTAIGFFIPTIIGVILIIKDKKENKSSAPTE